MFYVFKFFLNIFIMKNVSKNATEKYFQWVIASYRLVGRNWKSQWGFESKYCLIYNVSLHYLLQKLAEAHRLRQYILYVYVCIVIYAVVWGNIMYNTHSHYFVEMNGDRK